MSEPDNAQYLLLWKGRQFGPLSLAVGSVILRCFEKDPASRPSAEQVAALCGELCYLPLVREVGVIETYRTRTFGFIRSNGSDGVFFHVQNVLGPAPPALVRRRHEDERLRNHFRDRRADRRRAAEQQGR